MAIKRKQEKYKDFKSKNEEEREFKKDKTWKFADKVQDKPRSNLEYFSKNSIIYIDGALF